jgi:hypothetical protein
MIYEVTYFVKTTEEIEADSMVEARRLATLRQPEGVQTTHVEAREARLERERRDAEYKAWKATRDRVRSQHPFLEHRRDGKWECGGCLRTEDTEEAFLDTCCLGWAVDLLEHIGRHEAGEHNFTTRAKIGDGPWGPETYIYDHRCPRCIEQRMTGADNRA